MNTAEFAERAFKIKLTQFQKEAIKSGERRIIGNNSRLHSKRTLVAFMEKNNEI